MEKEIKFVKNILKREVSQETTNSKAFDSIIISHDFNVYASELENSRSLIQLLTKEIDTLQNSMAVILEEGAAKIKNLNEKSHNPENHAINLLQRQVRELRVVWTREVAANTFLRTLISKTQEERLRAEERRQLSIGSLQEEFDELAELFEGSRKEIELLKSEISRKDNALVAAREFENNSKDLGYMQDEFNLLKEKYLELQSDLAKRNSAFKNLESWYADASEKLESLQNNQKAIEASSSRIIDLYNNDSTNLAIIDIQQDYDDLKTKYTELKNSFEEKTVELSNIQNNYIDASEQLETLRNRRTQNDTSSSRIIIELQNLMKAKELDWVIEKEKLTGQLLLGQSKYSDAMYQLENLRKSQSQTDSSLSQVDELRNLLQAKEEDWLQEREKIMQQLLLAGEEVARLTEFVTEKQDEILELKNEIEFLNENKGINGDYQTLLEGIESSKHDMALKEHKWASEREDLIHRIEQRKDKISVGLWLLT